MFNRAIARQSMPKHLSSDRDPLFRFQRWLANSLWGYLRKPQKAGRTSPANNSTLLVAEEVRKCIPTWSVTMRTAR
jgi:hypothetical protein